MAEVPKAPVDEETVGSQMNGDGDRQVLAPSEGPREDLINTAIKFLLNPKVMGSPLQQKKAFLNKKGLTQEEISLAVERAGVTETTDSTSGMAVAQARPPPGYQPGMMAPGAYSPIYPPIPPQSRWTQLRDLTLTSVVFVSVTYAGYHLYKVYIEPLIRGKSVQEKRLDRLELQVEEIHKSVVDSLAEISKTLAAIQLTVNSQNQQQPLASQTVGRGITELKGDISSLRGLLLNKNQFPPPPTNSPILPSWQLAGASSVGPQQTTSSSNSSTSTANIATPLSTSSEDAMSASPGVGDTGVEEGKSTSESNTQPSTDQPSDKENQMNKSGEANIKEDAQSS